MANPLLIILSMAKSNHPHVDKIRFMLPMVDDHIRVSMLELDYEDCFPSVTDLEDCEYEEGNGDDDSPE